MNYLELNEKESDKMSIGELQFMIETLTRQRNSWREEVKEIERKQVWHNTKEIRKDKRVAKRTLWSKNHDLKMYKRVLESVKRFGSWDAFAIVAKENGFELHNFKIKDVIELDKKRKMK